MLTNEQLKLLQQLKDKVVNTPAVGGMKREALQDALKQITAAATKSVEDPEKYADLVKRLSSKELLSTVNAKNALKQAPISSSAMGDLADYGKFSKKAALVGEESRMPGLGALLGIGTAALEKNPMHLTQEVANTGLNMLGPAGAIAGAALSAEDLGPKSGSDEMVLEDPNATREQKRQAALRIEALNRLSKEG